MPELPDVELYLHALRPRLVGATLVEVLVRSPALLRSFDPPLREAHGKQVRGLRRLGKRIVFELEDDLHLIVHLMVGGRFQWTTEAVPARQKHLLAVFHFDRGRLVLNERATRKRAALWLVRGAAQLAAHDPGGLDVLECTLGEFTDRLHSKSHTLKRALADPRLFSGIGNAYGDEILHRSRLSPFTLSGRLDDEAVRRLYDACREVLVEWRDRLIAENGDGFPAKVTAFRPEMAVHGKYGEACPVCGTAVQRIRYAESETNYCPGCQTGGKIYADRSLSKLLGKDWPRDLDELEEFEARYREDG